MTVEAGTSEKQGTVIAGVVTPRISLADLLASRDDLDVVHDFVDDLLDEIIEATEERLGKLKPAEHNAFHKLVDNWEAYCDTDAPEALDPQKTADLVVILLATELRGLISEEWLCANEEALNKIAEQATSQ